MADFYGRALAFPPQPDGKGGLLTVEGPDAVASNIRAIISSMIGEHPFEPALGWPINVWAPIQDMDVAAQMITDAILNWEDRIRPESLRVDVLIGDEGTMNVDIRYVLRSEITARTLQQGFRLLKG
jgi:hypothetical protein